MTAPAGGAPATVAGLPSGTTVRFWILMALIVASTGSIYGYLGLIAQPGAEAAYRGCAGQQLVQVAGADSVTGGAAVLRCGLPYVPTIVGWSLAGTVLVVVASLVLYRAMGWWIATRTPRRLAEVGPTAWERAAGLARQADPKSTEKRLTELFRVDYAGRARPATTFGTVARPYVLISSGLMVTGSSDQADQRRTFEAVVRHELGHVSNRDNRATYVTVAAWRVFVALVLVPYLVFAVDPGLAQVWSGTPGAGLRPVVPDVHALAAVAAITALVLLGRMAVSRIRELDADACADATDEAGVLRGVLADLRRSQQARSGPALLRYQPTFAQRVRLLADPGLRGRPDPLAAFSAGVTIGLLGANVTVGVWLATLVTWFGRERVLRDVADAVAGTISTFAAIRLVLLIFGPMTVLTLLIVCWLASVSGWRAAVSVPGGGYRAEAVGAGALLALGMVVGEPLSVIYANAGTWGVWDTTTGYRIADVAASAAVILVVVMGVYGWAAECAAVWRPVLPGGPRRMVGLTAAVVAVGALPVMLTWTASHNTLALTAILTPGPDPLPLAGFPAQRLVRSQYLAPFFAASLPGVAVALVVPGLFVAVGSLRRSRLAVPRPAAYLGRTVAVGVVGAALTVEVALVVTELVRALVGVRAIAEATDVGLGPYFFQAIPLVMAVGAAVSAVVAARAAPGVELNAAALCAAVVVGLATPVAPFVIVAGQCTATARACVGVNLYSGAFAVSGPLTAVYAAVATAVLTAIAVGVPAAFRNRDATTVPVSYPTGSRHRGGTVGVIALTVVSLVASSAMFVIWFHL